MERRDREEKVRRGGKGRKGEEKKGGRKGRGERAPTSK